jgi:hypothetical protein
MGQSLSKKQSTFVFGSTVSVPIYKEPDEDNVLFKPFLYGLSTASLSSSTTLTYIPENTENDGRTDSGFLVCEQDAQLVQDLAYVDQTYYSDFHQQSSKKKTVLPRFLRQKKEVDGQLTLDDLSSICFDRPLHDLNLSKRWLGTLNSNFGLLYMVRRLDL